VFSQPMTCPPPLVHSVLLASSANIRWCVLKHVLMCVSFWDLGSHIARCRPARFTGNAFADGWFDPARQKGGLSAGRTVDVSQRRPRSSSIGLWTLFLLVQMTVSPQYGEGAGIAEAVAGVAGSRTVSGIWDAVCVTGSTTGT
jgi:hypothetical protein